MGVGYSVRKWYHYHHLLNFKPMTRKINASLIMKGFAVALLSAPLAAVAQNVAVENSNGTQTAINLGGVNSIVFSSGVIKLNSNDCQNQYFGLAVTDIIDFNPILSVEGDSFSTETLSVFPNPTEDSFVLTVSEAQMNTQASIWTSAGVCVKKWNVNRRSSTIEVNDLPAGLYIIQVGNTNAKLIKR